MHLFWIFFCCQSRITATELWPQMGSNGIGIGPLENIPIPQFSIPNKTISSNSTNNLIDCFLDFGSCESLDIFEITDKSTLTLLEDRLCQQIMSASINLTAWVLPHQSNDVSIVFFHISTLVISGVGFLANVITVGVIVKITKLHKPFYFSILFLALSDIVFHILFYIQMGVNKVHVCTYIKINRVIKTLDYSTKFNTSLNVIIMTTVRYVMFVYPLRSRVWLTNKKIFLCGGVSLVLSIAYGLLLNDTIMNIPTKYLIYLYILDDISVLVFFFTINILFLIQRIKTANASAVASHLRTRMVVIVIFVLSLNAINSLVRILGNIGVYGERLIEETDTNRKFNTVLQVEALGKLCNHIVHSVNPFLYFFSSPLVIRTCSAVAHCKR